VNRARGVRLVWVARGHSSAARLCGREHVTSPMNLVSTLGGPESCCLPEMMCVAVAELLVPPPHDSQLTCSHPQLGQLWPLVLCSTCLSSLPAQAVNCGSDG